VNRAEIRHAFLGLMVAGYFYPRSNAKGAEVKLRTFADPMNLLLFIGRRRKGEKLQARLMDERRAHRDVELLSDAGKLTAEGREILFALASDDELGMLELFGVDNGPDPRTLAEILK
jgi:peroxiredoxin